MGFALDKPAEAAILTVEANNEQLGGNNEQNEQNCTLGTGDSQDCP